MDGPGDLKIRVPGPSPDWAPFGSFACPGGGREAHPPSESCVFARKCNTYAYFGPRILRESPGASKNLSFDIGGTLGRLAGYGSRNKV